jgi:Flp pilus assembly protein CpaB
VLPALTFRPARIRVRRLLPAAAGGVLIVVSVLSILGGGPGTSASAPATRSLAERLSPASWGLTVATSWLATPVGEVRPGDRVDLLAVRTDRALAIPIAADLRVMAIDESAVVFEVDEDAATAIATARASNLLLVPLVRSTR